MVLAIGGDEKTALTDNLLSKLKAIGYELLVFGPMAGQAGTWVDVARKVAESIKAGQADEGILLCWTGTGVSIAANKVPGIRAALCGDAETARGARLWNDANVLCLSLRKTSEAIATEIIDAWFGTAYEPNPDDDACLRALSALETAYASR